MTLANIWFVLVAVLLTVYVILDGFDLGAGVLYPFVARSEDDKSVVRASIGPVWDGNEVWLLTGAGAIFAAFPMVYAMTFSGFYLAIMLVLFGLILRAVSLEFRHRDTSWKAVWDGTLLPRQPRAGAAGGRRPRQRHPRRAHGRAGQLHRHLLGPAQSVLPPRRRHGPLPARAARRGVAVGQVGGRPPRPCLALPQGDVLDLRRARRGDVARDHPHRVARVGQRVRQPRGLAVPGRLPRRACSTRSGR